MNIDQLQQGKVAKFAVGTDKACRLLFWYDPELSFKEALISQNERPAYAVVNTSHLHIIPTIQIVQF